MITYLYHNISLLYPISMPDVFAGNAAGTCRIAACRQAHVAVLHATGTCRIATYRRHMSHRRMLAASQSCSLHALQTVHRQVCRSRLGRHPAACLPTIFCVTSTECGPDSAQSLATRRREPPLDAGPDHTLCVEDVDRLAQRLVHCGVGAAGLRRRRDIHVTAHRARRLVVCASTFAPSALCAKHCTGQSCMRARLRRVPCGQERERHVPRPGACDNRDPACRQFVRMTSEDPPTKTPTEVAKIVGSDDSQRVARTISKEKNVPNISTCMERVRALKESMLGIRKSDTP